MDNWASILSNRPNMWTDEKTEYLRKNRDYSRLLDGDDAEVQTPRSQNRGRSKEGQFRVDDDDDVRPERQEYLNRRRRFLNRSADDGRRKAKSTNFSFSGGDKGHIHYVSTIMEQKPKPKNWLRTLMEGAVAGATAGVVVETVLYPIDTIKTRLQAARAGGKIVWTGLYSGLAGNLFGVLPASAVFVGVYEPVKHKLIDTFPDHLSAVAHLTAGAVGGAAASLIRVPTEVVKQRMQTLQFTSAPSAVRVIVAKEGIAGLYAGFGAFLLRDLPFDAIQFCLYEQVRIAYRRTVKRELYDPENAAMGAVAGAITGAVTTPLDVIKTRLMVQGSKGYYKNVFDCVAKILEEEGAGAFLKGVGPRVMWIGIGGSIFFTALERTKGLLARQSWSKADDFPNVRTA